MGQHLGHSRHTTRVADVRAPFRDGWTYRALLVRCGKRYCRVCKRWPAHGPYWYAERRKGRGNPKTRTVYIGIELVPVEEKLRRKAR